MATISIASDTIPNWQLGSDVQLRIYPLKSFEAADGTLEVQGSPNADQSQSANFYISVSCSLSGTALTISACSLESTTDAQDNPSATYGAWFYTTEGEQLGAFGIFKSFLLPATPANTTWGAIEIAQGAVI